MSLPAAFQALFEKLIKGGSSEDRKAAAQDVVTEMKQGGAASFAVSAFLGCFVILFLVVALSLLASLGVHVTMTWQAGGVVDKVKVALEDKDAEGGLHAVKALAETADAACESYVVAMLPLVMEKYADKVHSIAQFHTLCIHNQATCAHWTAHAELCATCSLLCGKVIQLAELA